jgi:acyl-CoA thioester hydrolase
MPEDYPIIRKFEPGDIDEIRAIERQAFPKTAYSRGLLLHYGVHYPETFVAMETEDGIVGYIIFDTSGHIHSTAVKAAHRRKGFGTMLFRYARKHVDRKLWLEVRSKNTGSIGFYKAVFLTYFEEGRKIFLRDVLTIVDPKDYPFILAHIDCDFLKPVKLGDTPVLEVWIGEIREKSFAFQYRIVERVDKTAVYTKGKSVMVLFDYEENRSVRIPKDFLEKIQTYCEKGQERTSA